MCQQPAIFPSTGYHLLLASHWSCQGNSSVADRETWFMLPTSSVMLPATTNHFDRAELAIQLQSHQGLSTTFKVAGKNF